MTETKAICPYCKRPSLVNVYVGIIEYVKLKADGTRRSTDMEGGTFDATYCERCDRTIEGSTFHDMEVENN